MPAEKLPVKFTVVQQLKQLEERIQLENHQPLPSQRYRVSASSLKLNPIVPQDVGAYADEQLPSGLLQRTRRKRPAQLGNPIFGYSGHRSGAADDSAGRMTQQAARCPLRRCRAPRSQACCSR